MVGGLLLAAAFAAPSSYGAAAPAADGWIDFHFAGADGSTHVVREPLALGGKHGCAGSSAHQNIANVLLAQHPELAGMKFVGANCGVATAGNAAPPGSGFPITPPRAATSAATPHAIAAGIWVDLHFKNAAGTPRVVVMPLQLARPDQAQAECSSPKHMAVLVKAAVTNDPSVAALTFVSANCEADAKGTTKMATGAWPAGKGPQFTEQRGFAPKVQSDVVEGPAAIVVLNYVASNGRHVKTAIGYDDGKASYYMRTCPAKLKQQLPALIQYAEATRVGAAEPSDPHRYDFATLKFVGAQCVPPPHMLGDLAGSNTSLEVTPPPRFN